MKNKGRQDYRVGKMRLKSYDFFQNSILFCGNFHLAHKSKCTKGRRDSSKGWKTCFVCTGLSWHPTLLTPCQQRRVEHFLHVEAALYPGPEQHHLLRPAYWTLGSAEPAEPLEVPPEQLPLLKTIPWQVSSYSDESEQNLSCRGQ